MTDEELDAIRARLDDADGWPWSQGEPNGCSIYNYHNWQIGETFKRANATLIAHAPTDIAALLAEVERLRAENAIFVDDVRLELRESPARPR